MLKKTTGKFWGAPLAPNASRQRETAALQYSQGVLPVSGILKNTNIT